MLDSASNVNKIFQDQDQDIIFFSRPISKLFTYHQNASCFSDAVFETKALVTSRLEDKNMH